MKNLQVTEVAEVSDFFSLKCWLFSPSKDLCMFFIHVQKSLISCLTVITQLWHCTKKGIPTKLKNSRTLDYKDAIETWHELQSNDWQLKECQIRYDNA